MKSVLSRLSLRTIGALSVVSLLSVGACQFDSSVESSSVNNNLTPDAAVVVDAPVVVQPDAPEPDAPIPTLTCPADFLPIEGLPESKYKIVPYAERAGWLAAEQYCESFGPGIHLLVPNRMEEITALGLMMHPDVSNHWLGIVDMREEGSFESVTGQLVALMWKVGEPNNGGDDTPENCVEARALGLFNDLHCEAELAFICECDGAVVDPSTYQVGGQ